MINLFVKNPTLPKQVKGSVGLIAGEGELPVLISKKLKQENYQVTIIAVERDGSDYELKELSDNYLPVRLKDGSKALQFAKDNNVSHIAMAGRVKKSQIYKDDFNPDKASDDVISDFKAKKGDDQILKRLSLFLKTQGIQVVGISQILKEDMAESGLLSSRELTPGERDDVGFGFKIAKSVGRLDIGQSIILKNKSVLAVEGIEGTDRMIQRFGEYGIPDAIFVKVAKPQQDIRFDLPIIGINTIKLASASGLNIIAVESGKVMIVNRHEVIKKANELNISIVGVPL